MSYSPAPGDIVWLDLDPTRGHEQGGHRPAIVLSAASYNRRTGLAICCPTTTRVKGLVFEVAIAGEPASVALCDQIKCVAWRDRGARHKGNASADEMAQIRAKLAALLDM